MVRVSALEGAMVIAIDACLRVARESDGAVVVSSINTSTVRTDSRGSSRDEGGGEGEMRGRSRNKVEVTLSLVSDPKGR